MAPGLNPTHAVAELRDAQDAQRLGTAFLVGSSLALTAFHCVRDHNRVLLRFLEHSAFASVVLRGDSEDDANDIALLHLDTDAPPEVARLPLSIDPEDDDEVTAIGFPLALAAPRFVVGGKVRSAHAQHPSRRHATHDDRYVQWFCEEALSGVALRGLSGGPLLSGPPGQRVAVGIVIFNEADRQGVARGGAVWAASAKTAVDLWSEELGQLLAKSIRYEYSETRLSGRAICSAVWSHSGDHYVVATQDALELYDACGVFDRKFPAPKACYLAGRNVQWDPGDARVAILADSGEFEVLDITSDRYIKVGSDIGLVNGWDQYSWSSDGRTIAIAANLFKTVGISGGVFFVPDDGGPSELKVPGLYRGVSMSPVTDLLAVSPWAGADTDGPLIELRRSSDASLVAEIGRASETGWASSLEFDPTGDLIGVAFEGFGVEIWRLSSRSRVSTLQADSGVITDVRWSSNARFLMVTSHEHQVVRIYERERWQLVGELKPIEQFRRGAGVNAGSVASDGTVLLVPQGERGVDVFRLIE